MFSKRDPLKPTENIRIAKSTAFSRAVGWTVPSMLLAMPRRVYVSTMDMARTVTHSEEITATIRLIK